MSIQIALRVRPYDHICPLLLGEIETPGLSFTFDTRGPLEMNFPHTLQAAEVSFNRYIMSYARQQEALIGLPAFMLRGFRHRNWFVLQDSPLKSLSDLRGKRVATNSWGDSGTLWARAALRDTGVEMHEVHWVFGQLDERTPSRKNADFEAILPTGAAQLEADDTLLKSLSEGRVDAITTAFAPDEIFTEGGTVRRLIQNYVEVEQEYHRRTGIYPNFHIIAVRKTYAEEHPQNVIGIYRALKASWDSWWRKARRFSETGPWAMWDHERSAIDFAGDMPPFGLESTSHRKMLRAFCDEQVAQGLTERRADPTDLFAGFERVMEKVGVSPADIFEPDGNQRMSRASFSRERQDV